MELMIRYALELAIVIPGAIFALIPVRRRTRFPMRFAALPAGALLAAFIVLGAYLCANELLPAKWMLLVFIPLCAALYLMLVTLPTAKKLFCFFTGCTLAGFSSMYTSYLAAPIEADGAPFSVTAGLVCLFLSLLLGALFFPTLSKRIPYLLDAELLGPFWKYFCLLPILLTLLDFWMTPLHPANVMVGRVRRISLVIMLVVPGVLYAFCQLLFHLTRSLSEQARRQQENGFFKMEQKRYDELQNYMAETRTLRHDFRQHLAVIDQLNRSGETQKLSAYLRQLIDVSAQTQHRRYCQNHAVDALAAHYDELSKEAGAVIEWSLNLPETLSVPDVEYCAMLGNLLENALYEVEKLPEAQRRIRVGSDMATDAILTLCVDNPYAGTVALGQDGLPKAQLGGHGIGLHSVAATVRRYHGTFNISTEAQLFSVDIVLYSK